MAVIEKRGVKIRFPFQPYPCQEDYMEKVITCLQQGSNGILESPTGTGKTLCLLTASLAWQEAKKHQLAYKKYQQEQENLAACGRLPELSVKVENLFKDQATAEIDQAAGDCKSDFTGAPKIIYASRTHSQLSQAMGELKRTYYKNVKACVIGSREQLCIHPTVSKETNNTVKVHMCRSKVGSRSCYFHNQLENTRMHFTNKVLDIEDLVTLGQKHQCCPYYQTRDLKKDADIVFMPYNYLLDPKLRKSHGVELQGNILIFDEAHNLEQICEENASFDLSSANVAAAISDLIHISEKIQEWKKLDETNDGQRDENSAPIEDFTLEDVLRIKAMLLDLEKSIDAEELTHAGRTLPGRFMFELFDKIDLTFDNKNYIIDQLDKMITCLTQDASSTAFSSHGHGISKITDVLKVVFSREPVDVNVSRSSHKDSVSRHYKVHLKFDESYLFKNKNKKSDGWGAPAAATSSSKAGRVLSYWCFSSCHTMEELKSHGVKCVILTSGTLSPLASFASELGLEFPVQLENPHVINTNQVFIGTVCKGPDGTKLSSAYNTRFNDDYLKSLGNSIVNFSRLVPHGMLVFFPSYSVMEKSLDHWQRSDVWARVETQKSIFVEPRGKNEFNTAISNFYAKVSDPSTNGAIFAAVCRGKVSEGLDFTDYNGRAVIITGLPYPPRMDPRVIIKMAFLDEIIKTTGKGQCGEAWYKQQASRAVNQAIGRVIRHRNDYGAIILCDERFAQRNAIAQLPSWLRPSIKCYENFGQVIKDLRDFYKTAEINWPMPEQRRPSSSKSFNTVPLKGHSADPRLNGPEGYYFEQVKSRTVCVKQLEKASTVVSHQPRTSHSDNVGIDRIRSSYSVRSSVVTDSSSATTSSRPNTLLGALDHAEQSKAMTFWSEPTLTSIQLAVRKRSAMTEKDGQSSSEEKASKKIRVLNPRIKAEHLQSAEEYLNELRGVVSMETYTQFSKAMVVYKAPNSSFMSLMEVLLEIFLDDPQKHHLLRKCVSFIRKQDRERFSQICLDITGQPCIIPPAKTKQPCQDSASNQIMQPCCSDPVKPQEAWCSAPLKTQEAYAPFHLKKELACDSVIVKKEPPETSISLQTEPTTYSAVVATGNKRKHEAMLSTHEEFSSSQRIAGAELDRRVKPFAQVCCRSINQSDSITSHVTRESENVKTSSAIHAENMLKDRTNISDEEKLGLTRSADLVRELQHTEDLSISNFEPTKPV